MYIGSGPHWVYTYNHTRQNITSSKKCQSKAKKSSTTVKSVQGNDAIYDNRKIYISIPLVSERVLDGYHTFVVHPGKTRMEKKYGGLHLEQTKFGGYVVIHLVLPCSRVYFCHWCKEAQQNRNGRYSLRTQAYRVAVLIVM